MYVCMYVCVYVCVCIYVYVYIIYIYSGPTKPLGSLYMQLLRPRLRLWLRTRDPTRLC